MLIGIDAHILTGKYQGSRKHLEEIYRVPLLWEGDHDWRFFLERGKQLPNGWPINTVFPRFPPGHSISRLAFGATMALKRERIDCFHSQYMSPLVKTTLEAVTIHDLLFETHPEYFPDKTRYFLSWAVHRSAVRADLIFTVSDYTKQALVQCYGIPEARIWVTPNAVDTKVFCPGDVYMAQARAKAIVGVDEFLLSVGRLESRKNYSGIVRAYQLLKARGKCLPKMVFIGARDTGWKAIFEEIQTLGLSQDILHLEGVAESDLVSLYRSSLGVLYPSFAEGFGIPIIEAQACGCPVLASNATAIPEVAGDSALLVDPHDLESLADGILRLLEGGTTRSARVTAGICNAARYNWAFSAKELLAGFNSLG